MAGTVGRVNIQVSPKFTGFRDKTRRQLREIKNTIEGEVNLAPNIDQRKWKRAVESLEKTLKVRVPLVAKIDKKSFTKAKAKIKQIVGRYDAYIVIHTKDGEKFKREIHNLAQDQHIAADITAVVNKGQIRSQGQLFANTVGTLAQKATTQGLLDGVADAAHRARVDDLKAKIADLKAVVHPEIDHSKVAAIEALKQDLARDMHVPTWFEAHTEKFDKYKDRIQGDTVFSYVSPTWKPGTFEPLKAAFFKAFPHLKPWVWPQIDADYVKASAARLLTNLQKRFRAAQESFLTMRAKILTDAGSEASFLTRMKALGAGGREALKVVFDESSFLGSYGRLLGILSKDALIPVRAVLNVPQVKAVGKAMGGFLRQRVNVVMESKAVTTVVAKAKKLGSTIKHALQTRFAPVLESKALTGAVAKAKAAGKAIKAALSVRAKAVVNVAKSTWAAYNKLGVRKVVRWKLELKIKAAVAAIKMFGKIASSTIKGSFAFSSLAMFGTSILALVGNIGKAMKGMAPALGPAVGVMGAFVAGAGVAAVAIKDASTQLKSLQGPLQNVQKGISEAFWGKAKAPILENAKKLINELTPSTNALSASMGGIFANAAQGAGASSAQYKKFLDNSTAGFNNMQQAMGRVVQAFSKLLAAGSSFFPKFGTWVDGLSQKFQAWVDAKEQMDGGLEGWMQGGLDTAKNVFLVLKNMLGIIGDIAKVAAGAGGSSLVEFNARLESIRATIASPEVQKGLGGFFSQVREGSTAVMAGVSEIIASFAQSGEALGRMVAAYGGTIGAVLTVVGQALTNSAVTAGLTAIADVVNMLVSQLQGPLFQVITSIGGAFASMGQTVMGLAPALSNMFQQIAGVADIAISAITSVFNAVAPALMQVVNSVLPVFVEVLSSLLPALASSFNAFVPSLAQILTFIGQVAGQIMGQIWPVIINLVDTIMPPLMNLVQTLLPPIAAILGEITNLITGVINAIAPALPPIIDAITIIGKALGDVLAVVGGAVVDVILSIVQALMPGVQMLAEALPPLLDAILPPIVQMVEQLFPPLVDLFNAIIEPLGQIISTLLPPIIDLAMALVEPLAQFIGALLPPLIDVLEVLIEPLTSIIEAILPPMVELFGQVAGALEPLMSTLLPPLAEIMTELLPILVSIIETCLPPLIELIEQIMPLFGILLPPITQLAMALLPVILSVIQLLLPVIQFLAEVFGTVLYVAIELIVGIISTVIGIVQGAIDIFNTIRDVAVKVWGEIWEKVSGFVQKLVDKISGFIDSVKNTWETGWNKVKSFVEDIWNGIVGFFEGAKDKVVGIFDKIGNGIKGAFDKAFNAVKSIWNNTIGKLSFTLPDWLPVVGGAHFSMPKLATGGIVTAPTMAIVGEGGDHEVVMPLPKIQPMLDAAVKASLENRNGVGKENRVYNITVRASAEDLKDVQTLVKFVDSLGTRARSGMRVGV